MKKKVYAKAFFLLNVVVTLFLFRGTAVLDLFRIRGSLVNARECGHREN